MGLKFQSEQKKYLKALNEIRTNLRTWTASFPTNYSIYKNLIRLTCKIVGSYTRVFTVNYPGELQAAIWSTKMVKFSKQGSIDWWKTHLSWKYMGLSREIFFTRKILSSKEDIIVVRKRNGWKFHRWFHSFSMFFNIPKLSNSENGRLCRYGNAFPNQTQNSSKR